MFEHCKFVCNQGDAGGKRKLPEYICQGELAVEGNMKSIHVLLELLKGLPCWCCWG